MSPVADCRIGCAVLVGLGSSAVSLATAPLLMPESYSWVAHTTSESAAQGVEGAWLARLGFLLLGLSVMALAFIARTSWGAWAAGFHYAFGALLAAAAAFSTRGWTGQHYDPGEDMLHSVAATAMGFAFAGGVVAALVHGRRRRRFARALDVVAVTASVAIPLAMTAVPDAAGLLQRAMFLVAYVWYATAALAVVSRRGGRRILQESGASRR